MLFNRQPNLFCSFTVNLGPHYVERVIDQLLTRSGIPNVARMSAAERYEHYLTFLRDGLQARTYKEYIFTQLFLGYFYQQQASLLPKADNPQHSLEKALCHYQNYLDLPAFPDEGRFYAQWQVGILQEQLDYPWQLAESALLAASTLDPLRGEPTRQITLHYVRNRDWEKAYRHSSSALKQYFQRNPIAVRRWHVDPDAYNWNVLRTHLDICYKLGYAKEAGSTYDQILFHRPKKELAGA